jgi:membrane protein YdbS with pleckstrin-like domain
MNKRVNTVLFILAATVANILVMMVIFLLLFVLFGRFLAPQIPPNIGVYVLMVLFVLSIVATYFIYHRAVRWLSSKYELEKYFGPIFPRRGDKK